MRRKFTYLLLSLFLLVGSGQAFADRNDNHGGKARQEHRGNNKQNNNNNKHGNKHKDKNYGRPVNSSNHGYGKPGNSKPNTGKPGNPHPGQGNPHHNQGKPDYRPGGHHNSRPVPPPPPAPVMRPGFGAAYNPGPALPPPPPRLPHMVNFATRGCQDVAVWQVSPDTYIVKYRKGPHWYTRYVYPYADQYGAPTLISVNWQPLSPWTLIPPIQLNINL